MTGEMTDGNGMTAALGSSETGETEGVDEPGARARHGQVGVHRLQGDHSTIDMVGVHNVNASDRGEDPPTHRARRERFGRITTPESGVRKTWTGHFPLMQGLSRVVSSQAEVSRTHMVLNTSRYSTGISTDGLLQIKSLE